jgi:hypothetical protein
MLDAACATWYKDNGNRFRVRHGGSVATESPSAPTRRLFWTGPNLLPEMFVSQP